ncbi:MULTISPECIES: RNA polymerase sigma factor [Olivibacter]|uniref:RNA polymerase, sigma-24 subunit, ECF subfamily n=3 Tax=Sphingobacteriaceae TaxID=84566 RepID=F4C6R0_SPHS2|nr:MULTISPECIES: RNA polymerase sigma-70 factor [Olivibacter]MCL4641856.1 RNA polymerase sigma-70 factor [Olivibacter sp. UJ_SKK_5.1]MDM8177072.1 RNA polymerase sigma-70 factor [Olivibacter sp. 47]MDX3912518.1 RNA polymerase sigma-70 factor [Pseudosphingobacterium sp.]
MIHSHEEEKSLILLIKDGNEVAFRQIYDRYRTKIVSFAYRFLKNEEDAEEVMQETFIRFWQARDRLDHSFTAAPLLFTISRRLVLNELRKIAQSEKAIAELLEKSDRLDHLSQDIMAAKEIDEKSKEALNQLSPQQKTIFCLSRYEGLSHDQIAERLQISPHTVNNHLVEGLKKIRKHLLRYGLIHFFLLFYF